MAKVITTTVIGPQISQKNTVEVLVETPVSSETFMPKYDVKKESGRLYGVSVHYLSI
jgi:hypothetical protein